MKGARSTPPRNKTQKFLFDKNIFDAPEEEEEIPAEPPPPTFSVDELDTARKKAFNDGMAKGRQDATNEALASREHMVTQVLQALAQNWADILAAENTREMTFEHEAVNLSHGIFEKILPLYSHEHGLDEIRDTITQVLNTQDRQSKISIYVHPDALEGIEAHLKTLSQQMAGSIDGRYEVIVQENMPALSVRLNWKDGGAVRDIEKLTAEIRDILKDKLAAHAAKRHDNTIAQHITDGGSDGGSG